MGGEQPNIHGVGNRLDSIDLTDAGTNEPWGSGSSWMSCRTVSSRSSMRGNLRFLVKVTCTEPLTLGDSCGGQCTMVPSSIRGGLPATPHLPSSEQRRPLPLGCAMQLSVMRLEH